MAVTEGTDVISVSNGTVTIKNAGTATITVSLPETANSNQKLFLVCDGVGGAEKGEIASSLACEAFQTFFQFFAKVSRM